MMIDPFGRAISYVRVSVTDRCDFRCVYCMAEDMTFLPKKDLLCLEELDRLCTTFIELGVRKIRLTGGEPLVRRNIMSLFGSLGRHLRSGALDEITLTTNGSQLARFAGELSRLRRPPDQCLARHPRPGALQAITRWGKYDKVMAGIEAAKAAGLARQDQHGGAQGRQRGRARPHDRLVRRRGVRSHPDRDHAAWATSTATGPTSICRCPWCAPVWPAWR